MLGIDASATGIRAKRVLLVGASTRAAAESAACAGFRVTAIDAFGDLDQHPSVRGLSLPRDFRARVSAQAGADAAKSITCDAVAYLSSFENHPKAVSTLAAGRELWGNPPPVLQRVRDPQLVAQSLRRRGIANLSVHGGLIARGGRRVAGSIEPLPNDKEGGRWLVKPLASGAGLRVRTWHRDMPVPRTCYLQEFVHGTPGSMVFVAAGGCAVPLGISLQLVGESDFGVTGYCYCGSILTGAGDILFPNDDSLTAKAATLARALTEDFDLVGVNCVDFVARDGIPYPIEINPRWSASMELVEHVYGLSVFGAHAEACTTGVLPAFDLVPARRGALAVGKAVVFAQRDVTLGDTRPWLADGTVRDVPHPGERILSGRPVCTVFAEGRNATACRAALAQRAERVYATLAPWEHQLT